MFDDVIHDLRREPRPVEPLDRRRWLLTFAPIACAVAIGCGDSTAPRRARPNTIVDISPRIAGAFASLGAVQAFRATVTDTLGDTLTEAVTWRASNTAGSTAISVTSDGTVTVAPSATPGDYALVAAAGGAADTATVRVLPAPTGKLIFSARVGSDGQIFVKDFAVAGDAAQITAGSGSVAGIAVDQKSGIIFFSQGAIPVVDIYRVAASGAGLVNLTNDAAASNQGPAVDPVTGDVYFSRKGLSGTTTQIFRMAPDGSALTQVTTTDQGKIQPAVSPDGSSLAWSETFQPGSNLEVMTAAIDGSNPLRLTNRVGVDGATFWFSNTRLLWSFFAPGTPSDIFSADLSNPGTLVNLTNGAGQSSSPSGGCAANTVTILRTTTAPGVYQLDLATGLAVPYTLPVSRSISFARRLC